jgi:hypothetical protein
VGRLFCHLLENRKLDQVVGRKNCPLYMATPASEALAKHKVTGKTASHYINTQGEAEVLRCVALFEAYKGVFYFF